MSIPIERHDSVSVVTINRPEAMNAIDPETNAALEAAWKDFDADNSLRVAVLTGAGSLASSAGADLKTLIPQCRTDIRNGEDHVWNFGG